MESMFIDVFQCFFFSSRGIMGCTLPKVPANLASHKASTLCWFQGMYCKVRAYLKVSPLISKSVILHSVKARERVSKRPHCLH